MVWERSLVEGDFSRSFRFRARRVQLHINNASFGIVLPAIPPLVGKQLYLSNGPERATIVLE